MARAVHVDQSIGREAVTVDRPLDHEAMQQLAGLARGDAGAGLEEGREGAGARPSAGGEHAAKESEGRGGGRGVGQAAKDAVPGKGGRVGHFR